MLSVRHVSKRFGATQALLDAQLDVIAGEVHALVGGNGCGKSTLIKCLAGVHQADRGTAVIGSAQVDLTRQTPDIAESVGLRFVHQDLGIFPSLSVIENLFIRSHLATTRWGRLDRKQASDITHQALGRFGLNVDPETVAGNLSPPEKALLAIARALLERPVGVPVVLVLDEPTASLSKTETEILLGAMREFARAGDAILFVTHRLDEVRDVADRVTAFRDGRYVATEPATGMTNAELAELIVGEAGTLKDVETSGVTTPRKENEGLVLDVRHLSGGPVADVSFELRKGEILGIAGLLGSGRGEVLRMIYGLLPSSGGSIRYNGNLLVGHNANQTRRGGIAFVSDDRLGEGIFSDRSVCDNLVAGDEGQYFSLGLMRSRRMKSETSTDLRHYGIRAESVETPIESLSGGNQQKAILARWLRRHPSLLLLDEPTQGVDVGARQDIYRLIVDSVRTGASVIVVSSEFEELALLCDRVIVITRGRISATFVQPMQEAELVAAAIGGANEMGSRHVS